MHGTPRLEGQEAARWAKLTVRQPSNTRKLRHQAECFRPTAREICSRVKTSRGVYCPFGTDAALSPSVSLRQATNVTIM